MANYNYPGETWKITRTLKDSDNSNINFTDVVSMTVKVFDVRGVSKTYTKANGDIVVGDTTNSFKLEISATDTSDFSPGKIHAFITWTFPSVDFSSNATDKQCVELLTARECR